eukprot:TRINITY_DN2248_c2_g1_i1.p1 TRINITY_DN2248_c2_g1~~TRINITY_DN2248_c2_g1_i1.p1  ORF type:complete len:589 (-),score=212.79 TRINITY_DN2248_c2_g1_i1:92-1858(-)
MSDTEEDKKSLLTVFKKKDKGKLKRLSTSNLIYEKDDLEKRIAISDFESKDEGDICFKKGDTIWVRQKDGTGWAEGELEDGTVGWFAIECTDIYHDKAVAEVGTVTGVAALDAFILQAKEKKMNDEKEIYSTKNMTHGVDLRKKFKQNSAKRDSLNTMLALQPMKENPASQNLEKNEELTEILIKAKKNHQKQEKKKKTKKHVCDLILQDVGGTDLTTPRGGKYSGPPLGEGEVFGMDESAIDDLAIELCSLVKGKHHYHLSSYDNVFTGTQLVNFLIENEKSSVSSKEDAITLAQSLLNRNIIVDATSQKTEPKFKSKLLYYLQFEQTEYGCINTDKIWSKKSPVRDCYEISVDILTSIIDVYNKEEDLEKIRTSKDFYRVALSLAEFQRATLLNCDETKKKCFFANLNNLMTLFLHAKFYPPTNNLEKNFLRETLTILTNGKLYNLSLIEKSAQLLSENDEFIHFCLSDCSYATPNTYIFTSDTYELKRRLAARKFLKEQCHLNEADYSISVPKLCKTVWNEETNSEIVDKLKPLLQQKIRKKLNTMLETGDIEVKFNKQSFDTSYVFEDSIDNVENNNNNNNNDE